MTRLYLRKIPALLIFVAMLLMGCQSAPQTTSIYQKASPYDFDDTMFNLDIAISEHNYRIIHRSDIGQAIRDRGETNFPLSTIVNFCNITYAREMMLINDNLINEMACEIAVRERNAEVIVSSSLMNEHAGSAEQQKFAKKINQNIKKIIEATVL